MAAVSRPKTSRRPRRSRATRGSCGSGTTGGAALIAGCRPNAAHDVIAAWSKRQRAPRWSRRTSTICTCRGNRTRLIRIHGSIWELSCWGRCARGATPWRDDRVPLDQPRCPHCGRLARPAVVWFGESLRREDVEAATRGNRVRRVPDGRDVGDRVSGRRPGPRSPPARRVHRGDQPRSDAGVCSVDVAIQGAAEAILPLVAEHIARLIATTRADFDFATCDL